MYLIKLENKIIAFTKKTWLLNLYLANRMYLNDKILIQKIKNNELQALKLNQSIAIHYFHGFALTENEIEAVDYLMSQVLNPDEFRYYYQSKPKGKTVCAFYEAIQYPDTKMDFIERVIKYPGLAQDTINEKYFFESLKGGM